MGDVVDEVVDIVDNQHNVRQTDGDANRTHRRCGCDHNLGGHGSQSLRVKRRHSRKKLTSGHLSLYANNEIEKKVLDSGRLEANGPVNNACRICYEILLGHPREKRTLFLGYKQRTEGWTPIRPTSCVHSSHWQESDIASQTHHHFHLAYGSNKPSSDPGPVNSIRFLSNKRSMFFIWFLKELAK